MRNGQKGKIERSEAKRIAQIPGKKKRRGLRKERGDKSLIEAKTRKRGEGLGLRLEGSNRKREGEGVILGKKGNKIK